MKMKKRISRAVALALTIAMTLGSTTAMASDTANTALTAETGSSEAETSEDVIAEETSETATSLPDQELQSVSSDEEETTVSGEDAEVSEGETETTAEVSGEESETKEEEGLSEEESSDAEEEIEALDGEEDTVETALVKYSGHTQKLGWLDEVSDGTMLGYTAKYRSLDAIKIQLGSGVSGGIEYRTYVQDAGWTSWVADGAQTGTIGKYMDEIQIRLTGEAADVYDVYYRVYSQLFGWLDWTKNGGDSGTSGIAKRLEAIEIKLVKKGEVAPGSMARAFTSMPSIAYEAYRKGDTWTGVAVNGATAGSANINLEAIVVNTASGNTLNGSVTYRTYCQNDGWKAYSSNWGINGVINEGKRVEQVQISLDGELGAVCNIYYRVYVHDYGWLGWAANGQSAGTTGLALPIEAIEIKIASKDGAQPVAAGNCLKSYTSPGIYTIGAKNYFYTSKDNYVTGTGWFRSGGNRYYAVNGSILTGWHTIGGLKYYFNSNGTLCQDVDARLGQQQSYYIKVNKAMNCVTIYAPDESGNYCIPVKAMLCSTGGANTAVGTYQTQAKYEWRTMINNTYGHYCTRIYGQVMFHSICYKQSGNIYSLEVFGYNNLGVVQSAGCVRLVGGNAYWIWKRCALGTTVQIYEDASSAGPFDRPTITPLPGDQNYDPTLPEFTGEWLNN